MKASDQQSFDRDRYLECILISFKGSGSLILDVTLQGACRSGPKQVLFYDLRDELQPPWLADNCIVLTCQSLYSANQVAIATKILEFRFH